MQDRETVVLPRKPDKRSASRQAKVSILRVLEFDPETLKSGTVVLSDDASSGSALLFVRGAPSVIQDLVQPASVPNDFNQVSYQYYLTRAILLLLLLMPMIC